MLLWSLAVASAAGCSGESSRNDPSAAQGQSASTADVPGAASPEAAPATRGVGFRVGERVVGANLAERTEGRITVAVHEPYEQREVRFEAFPALALFDEMFGPTWRTADELLFTCADGYRATVPVSRFLAHEAYVAIAREGASFAIDKPVGDEVERTELTPAYLIWENQRDALIRSEGDWGWPYQIVVVSMVSAAEGNGRMAPLPDAGEPAQRGFAVFRRYCSRCHAINGQGGELGPELNYPASVTEYLEPTWLRRWIDAPLTVRHGTHMPGLPPGIPEREAALDDVNLDIQRGEILALLGPNGAGKTTLIGIVCGIVTPTVGKVVADGHDIVTDFRAARAKIGLVPQELSTDAFESVWATVSFSRGLFGKPKDPALIERILRDLSLWDKRDARIKTLSGGMKRRVMIAKALSHEPTILFLDEPSAGVDVELRRDMWELVRRLRDQGVTTLGADQVAAAFVEGALVEWSTARRADPQAPLRLKEVTYEAGPAFIEAVKKAVPSGVEAAHARIRAGAGGA